MFKSAMLKLRPPTLTELGVIIAVIGLIGIGMYKGKDLVINATEKHCREVQTELAAFIITHYADPDGMLRVTQSEIQPYAKLDKQARECNQQPPGSSDHYDFKHFGLVAKPKTFP